MITAIIEDKLQNFTWLPKTINSTNDFITINCDKHGLYYRTIADINNDNTECPRCQFLHPSRMATILEEAREEIKKDLSWLHFWNQYKRDLEYIQSTGLYYRILVTHKETGYMFQKIGIIESTDPDFDEQWNPYKWKDFIIEPIDKIECTVLEANTIEALFQKYNSQLKITVPNYLKFNLNKTYEPDFIWQARSKTIKPLRDVYSLRQKHKCAICGRLIEKPTLDHVHTKKVKGTGLIRNVLCSMCNTFLARIENNASRHSLKVKDLPDILRRTADHLEQEKQVIHPTEAPKRKKVGKREYNKVKKHYFDVYPNRRTLPKMPTYVTNNWLQMVQDVKEYLENKEKKK